MSLLLSLVARLLALDDAFGDSACLEQVDGQRSVVAMLHLAVENLLYNIVHNIVEKVVPRKAEEEVLYALERTNEWR